MKKKDPIQKEITPKKVKKETKKKEKDVHICSKCLKEIKPTSLFWVSVTDKLGLSFQTLICEDCIENKESYIHRYESFEVMEALYKKRVYKKKNKDA